MILVNFTFFTKVCDSQGKLRSLICVDVLNCCSTKFCQTSCTISWHPRQKLNNQKAEKYRKDIGGCLTLRTFSRYKYKSVNIIFTKLR